MSVHPILDAKPRFPNVSCSQCGRDFGPGDNGFSHCWNHSPIKAAERIVQWVEDGQLVDHESLVQSLAPIVAKAYLAKVLP
jgi:hypothetical protein